MTGDVAGANFGAAHGARKIMRVRKVSGGQKRIVKRRLPAPRPEERIVENLCPGRIPRQEVHECGSVPMPIMVVVSR